MDNQVCKLVILSDMQIDYQDKKTLAVVHRFLSDFQPDTLVLNGDIIDMTALSKYRLTLEQRAGLKKQRDELRQELRMLREATPHAHIALTWGNHEQRLADYITDHAPELEFLGTEVLSFQTFADLDALEIESVGPYGAAFKWHGVDITHGTRVVTNTAKANLSYEGGSGVSGHTHRMSSFFKTDRSGAHAWFEGGCLCELEAPHSPPPTTPGIRDWQQGIVVGYGVHARSGAETPIWNLYLVHITKRRFLWEGKVYGPN